MRRVFEQVVERVEHLTGEEEEEFSVDTLEGPFGNELYTEVTHLELAR